MIIYDNVIIKERKALATIFSQKSLIYPAHNHIPGQSWFLSFQQPEYPIEEIKASELLVQTVKGLFLHS